MAVQISRLCPSLSALYYWLGLLSISELPSSVVIHICLTGQWDEHCMNYISLSEKSRKIKQYDKAITYLDDSQTREIIMKRIEEKKAS
jgi:hypothetical protein